MRTVDDAGAASAAPHRRRARQRHAQPMPIVQRGVRAAEERAPLHAWRAAGSVRRLLTVHWHRPLGGRRGRRRCPPAQRRAHGGGARTAARPAASAIACTGPGIAAAALPPRLLLAAPARPGAHCRVGRARKARGQQERLVARRAFSPAAVEKVRELLGPVPHHLLEHDADHPRLLHLSACTRARPSALARTAWSIFARGLGRVGEHRGERAHRFVGEGLEIWPDWVEEPLAERTLALTALESVEPPAYSAAQLVAEMPCALQPLLQEGAGRRAKARRQLARIIAPALLHPRAHASAQ